MPRLLIKKELGEGVEYYPTEPSLVEAILDTGHFNGCKTFLDVGAGDGIWGKALQAKTPFTEIDGIELRDLPKPKEYRNWYNESVYSIKLENKYDAVFGNPPFSIYTKENCVKTFAKLFNSLNDNGVLGFLLKSSFLGSVYRHENLFSKYKPTNVYNIVPRPSFSGDNKTSGEEYIFVVFKKNYYGVTYLNWLRFERDKQFTWEKAEKYGSSQSERTSPF